MELLDDFIHNSFNIGYGIGLAIIISAFILIVVVVVRGEKSISPFCYLLALVLAVLLSLQFSFMFGAIKAKEEINNVSGSINGYAKLITSSDCGYSTTEDIGQLIEEFQKLIPGLSAEMGQLTLGRVDKSDIGGSLMAPAKSYLNKYILFRILWSLLFVVVATISMIMLPCYGGTSNYRKSHIRRERVSSRRSSDGRRPSRRTRRY